MGFAFSRPFQARHQCQIHRACDEGDNGPIDKGVICDNYQRTCLKGVQPIMKPSMKHAASMAVLVGFVATFATSCSLEDLDLDALLSLIKIVMLFV